MGDGFLAIGRITKPHGLRGQVKVRVDSDVRDQLQPGRRVRLGGPGPVREYEVETFGFQGNAGLLGLAGVRDRDAAEALVGGVLEVEAGALPALSEGEYYWHQVAGLRVVSEEGRFLGTLADMFSTPAHDVWVARAPGQEYLIPAVGEVVLSVNPAEKEVRVRRLSAWWEGDGH